MFRGKERDKLHDRLARSVEESRKASAALIEAARKSREASQEGVKRANELIDRLQRPRS